MNTEELNLKAYTTNTIQNYNSNSNSISGHTFPKEISGFYKRMYILTMMYMLNVSDLERCT